MKKVFLFLLIFSFLFILGQAKENFIGKETSSIEKSALEKKAAIGTKRSDSDKEKIAEKKLEYIVTIETDKGNIVFKMFPEYAPNTVARITELIQQGFYDGLTFHRVVPGFVIQGGDPLGNGTGGTGIKLKAEFNELPHKTGTVGMARAADPDSADCQFYICLAPQPQLDRQYTVFGQVIEGLDIIQKIEKGDVMRKVTIK